MLHDPARHTALPAVAWRAGRARDAAAAAAATLAGALRADGLWPLHPADRDPDTDADAAVGLYCGAAGLVVALLRLRDAGLWDAPLDLAAIMAPLHDRALVLPDEPGAGPSLLVGTSGILLVAHRVTPSAEVADLVAAAIAASVDHPAEDLLLGTPGTLLAADVMARRTGEERFTALWRRSADALLARRRPDGLWTQDLYGRRLELLGAAHGLAGIVRALVDGDASAADDATDGLVAHAVRADGQATWAPMPGGTLERVQWCHGGPGVITSCWRTRPGDDAWTGLLVEAGELVWAAGPLAGGAGLCHGTAGNGFALLALFHRTQDERWLARARAFAVAALAQADPDRHALFTGGIGAALLAAACLGDGDPRFPGLDDLA